MSIFELELNPQKLAIFRVVFEQAIFEKKKIIGTPKIAILRFSEKPPSGPSPGNPPEGPEGPGPPRTPPDPPGPPRTPPDPRGPPRTSAPPALRASGPEVRRGVPAPGGGGGGTPLNSGPPARN